LVVEFFCEAVDHGWFRSPGEATAEPATSAIAGWIAS